LCVYYLIPYRHQCLECVSEAEGQWTASQTNARWHHPFCSSPHNIRGTATRGHRHHQKDHGLTL